MSQERIVNLLELLSARSTEGKLKWERTETSGVFQAAFPSYSIRIWSVDNDNTIYLGIYDQAGETVEVVSDEELRTELENSYKVMKELHEQARRSAMGIDEALDAILSALNDQAKQQPLQAPSSQVPGPRPPPVHKPAPPPPPRKRENDDLPF